MNGFIMMPLIGIMSLEILKHLVKKQKNRERK